MNMSKKESTTFATLADLIKSVSDDHDFNKKLEEKLRQREVVTTLFALRMARNVSQGEVAQRLGCSQSRVSKIENGNDGELRLRELSAYAEAMDYQIELAFTPKNETLVEAVKRHAFRVKALLGRIAELSHKDSKIAEGAAGFFGEAFFNFVKIISDSAKKLPERADGKAHITITVNDDRICDLDRAHRRLVSAPSGRTSNKVKRLTHDGALRVHEYVEQHCAQDALECAGAAS